MKNIIILFTILISITTTFAQNEPIKSDLRLKIDSIIEYQLKPQTLDTAALRGQTSICFSKDSLRKSIPIIRSRASIPHTTMPLVILDRKIVELEEELSSVLYEKEASENTVESIQERGRKIQSKYDSLFYDYQAATEKLSKVTRNIDDLQEQLAVAKKEADLCIVEDKRYANG